VLVVIPYFKPIAIVTYIKLGCMSFLAKQKESPLDERPFFCITFYYATRSMVTDSRTTGVLGRSMPSRETLLIFSTMS
jgi:hypothetical protein